MTGVLSEPGSARSGGKDYRSYSFWLETAGEVLTPRPSPPGSTDADVAILGAGFTGLWTAYYLLAAGTHFTRGGARGGDSRFRRFGA